MRDAGRCSEEVISKLPEVAEKSKNFSGAELEGLVRSASSFALSRAIDPKDLSKTPDLASLKVVYEDFSRALSEVEPKFGSKSSDMCSYYRAGMINYGEAFDTVTGTILRVIEQMKTSEKTPLMSLLLEGKPETGKTGIAAYLASNSGIPFVRVISADALIGMTETGKALEIQRNFLEAYKSPLSLIVLDDLERLIEYIRVGPRFSNQVLQALLILLKKPPPEDRRLLIIGTTSAPQLLSDLSLTQSFSISQHVPLLQPGDEAISIILRSAGIIPSQLSQLSSAVSRPIGIKTLLMIVEMARCNSSESAEDGKAGEIDASIFMECLHTTGYEYATEDS